MRCGNPLRYAGRAAQSLRLNLLADSTGCSSSLVPVDFALPGSVRCVGNAARQAADIELSVAVILERLPVVTPTPPPWKIKYYTWFAEANNRKRAEKPAKWIDIDREAVERAGDQPQEHQWQPADRITDADRSGDIKSLWRCLEERLYFVVKQQGSQEWRFPQKLHSGGESMRAAAERVLQASSREPDQPQEALQTFFLGKGPIGHLDGLFFHRAQLIKGSLTHSREEGFTDYAWLTKAELTEQTADARLKDLLLRML